MEANEGRDMTSCNFEARIEKLARCRAVVLQAINAQPGMTYTEIRKWIEKHKGFTMERVQARCSELYYLVDVTSGKPFAHRVTKEDNRVHVYPSEAKEAAST